MEIRKIPAGTCGIYALLNKRPMLNKFDVVYIGMLVTHQWKAIPEKNGVREFIIG
jgi:hypothetical protein